jgi:uncharacterized protein (UPF0332 family)
MDSRQERYLLAGCWLKKADESFLAAKVLVDAQCLGASVSRMYYAVFYAASALFTAQGNPYGRHSGIQAAIHRDLVKTGHIPKELGELYNRMYVARQEGDNKAVTKVVFDDMATELAEVDGFIQYFRNLVGKEIKC